MEAVCCQETQGHAHADKAPGSGRKVDQSGDPGRTK